MITYVEIFVGEDRQGSHWIDATVVTSIRPHYKGRKVYRFGDGTLSIAVAFYADDYASEDYAKWIANRYREIKFKTILCKWYKEDWKKATVRMTTRKVDLNV